MSGYIRISTSRLRNDKKQIENDVKAACQEITGLAESMQQLSQTWEGAAWQAFQNQLAEDLENMQQVGKKLAEFLDHMNYAESQYRACEQEVENTVSRIRV